MRRQDRELDVAFFDRLALVSREPDTYVDELTALYEDQGVNVPGTVRIVSMVAPSSPASLLIERPAFGM
jgi:hypothetical protein